MWERKCKKKNLLTDKEILLLQEEHVVLDVSPLIHTVTSAAVPDRREIITAGFDISVAFWVFFMTAMSTDVRERPRNAG